MMFMTAVVAKARTGEREGWICMHGAGGILALDIGGRRGGFCSYGQDWTGGGGAGGGGECGKEEVDEEIGRDGAMA
jgi:hypothetical protein